MQELLYRRVCDARIEKLMERAYVRAVIKIQRWFRRYRHNRIVTYARGVLIRAFRTCMGVSF
jgi:hypothetical protein